MSRTKAILVAVAVLAVAPRASSEERAADVLGGQGRGSGSGKSSMDRALGSERLPAKLPGAYPRRPDDPRDAQRLALPTPDAQPSDPKMSRIGGTPGETPPGAARAPSGSPAGSEPEHVAPPPVPGAAARP
jgi:hypothetical protein